jgi:hypothetical protein
LSKRKCPDCAGKIENLAQQALGITFLLIDEGFQEALRSQIEVPGLRKG